MQCVQHNIILAVADTAQWPPPEGKFRHWTTMMMIHLAKKKSRPTYVSRKNYALHLRTIQTFAQIEKFIFSKIRQQSISI